MLRLLGVSGVWRPRASALGVGASSSRAIGVPMPSGRPAVGRSVQVRGLSTARPLSSARTSSASGVKRDARTTSVTSFGSGSRVSSAVHAGPISPPAPVPAGKSSLLAEHSRAALLNPTHVRPGLAAKSAQRHRDLHERNPNRLNHHLAHYVDKSSSWRELVELLFDHMHQLNLHNYVRSLHRLGQLRQE